MRGRSRSRRRRRPKACLCTVGERSQAFVSQFFPRVFSQRSDPAILFDELHDSPRLQSANSIFNRSGRLSQSARRVVCSRSAFRCLMSPGRPPPGADLSTARPYSIKGPIAIRTAGEPIHQLHDSQDSVFFLVQPHDPFLLFLRLLQLPVSSVFFFRTNRIPEKTISSVFVALRQKKLVEPARIARAPCRLHGERLGASCLQFSRTGDCYRAEG